MDLWVLLGTKGNVMISFRVELSGRYFMGVHQWLLSAKWEEHWICSSNGTFYLQETSILNAKPSRTDRKGNTHELLKWQETRRFSSKKRNCVVGSSIGKEISKKASQHKRNAKWGQALLAPPSMPVDFFGQILCQWDWVKQFNAAVDYFSTFPSTASFELHFDPSCTSKFDRDFTRKKKVDKILTYHIIWYIVNILIIIFKIRPD